jgi:hypothetical protein
MAQRKDPLRDFRFRLEIDGIQQAAFSEVTIGKKLVIVAVDEAGIDKARFVVSEAWPVRYGPIHLNAKGNEVCIEAIELANEGIERVA